MGWSEVGLEIGRGEFEELATTEYFLTDTLPTLPTLQDSSLNCNFCRVLRDALLNQYADLIRGVNVGRDPKEDQDRRDADPSLLTIRGFHSRIRFPGPDFFAVQLQVTILKRTEHSGLELFKGPFFMEWRIEAAEGNQSVTDHLNLPKPLKSLFDIKDLLPASYLVQDYEFVNSTFVPKMLLDVRDEPARLVSRETILTSSGRVPKYAALSYCWGPPEAASQQHTLTRDTLAQRLQQIRLEELPLTVRDAVCVTRALTLPYLWVDALCILQDDVSDWEQQCVDMHKIYGNAHITLCAAASKSCIDGLVQPHQYHALIPFKSAVHDVVGYYSLRLDIIGTKKLIAKYAPPVNKFTPDGNSWHNRGWVFQERASSHRKLLFWRNSIGLFCPSSDDLPLVYHTISGDCVSRPWELGVELTPMVVFRISRPNDHHSQGELLDMWLKLIRSYSTISASSFTNPLDILPAISGLAAMYHPYLTRNTSAQGLSRLIPDYIAGYWKQDLARSMLWSINLSGGHAAAMSPRIQLSRLLESLRTSSQKHRIPSWSQLTRDGSLNMFTDRFWATKYCNFRPTASILDARTKPAGDNPFGYTQENPHLLLQTKVVNLKALTSPNVTVKRVPSSTPYYSHQLFDGNQPLCLIRRDFADSPRALDGEEERKHHQALLKELSSCYLALIGNCDVKKRWESRRRRYWNRLCFRNNWDHKPIGLVLHPVPNGSPSDFYRVGIFMPNAWEPSRRLPELFESMGETREICLY
ncbi:heterokaryon incompatibility protein-domain-containing protein [Triangularia verruculosa]|uniref:Heterokaryon incompatibility protein-domain-containing protein n=1 Tax=Triangularia verruculosa TaxID=2587418 RepID=A0AAN7AWU9_9PEZI|nr:heterokaryon incompatibility protein-domain-containing protein [Triangularia verruculosa]